MFKRRTFKVILLAVAMVALGFALGRLGRNVSEPAAKPEPGPETESTLPPPNRNAAINYLLAAATLNEPWPPEFITKRDLETHLGDPVIDLYLLQNCPEFRDFVSEDLGKGGPVWLVHHGARMPYCRFNAAWDDPFGPAPHLPVMREIGMRCKLAASCAEAQGNTAQAVEISDDLLQMAIHIGGTGTLLELAVGFGGYWNALERLEFLLSREPDRDALEAILATLDRQPERPFKPEHAVRREAEMWASYLRREKNDLREGLLKKAEGYSALADKTGG